MENKLEQLKKLKSLTLSEAERGFLRAHATHVMHSYVPKPNTLRSMFHQGVHHGLRIALSSLLFVVFAGGTVSAVADNALPGDPLYAFKLGVNEQIKAAFLSTPEEKVAYQQKRIESRVAEIQTLADSKTLTKAKQETVKKALDSHISDLSKDLNDLPPSVALSATTTIEDSLKGSKQTLLNTATTDNDTSKENAIKTVDGALKKVSDQEVKIISKEINAIANSVSATTPVVPSASASLNTTATVTTPPPPVTPVGP